MIEVTAAIIFRGTKLLIARRGEGKHLAGLWEFPGGKLEEGEDIQSCLQREIKEELGIDIVVGDYYMNNKHSYGTKEISLTAFVCTISSGDIILHDHDRIEWVEPQQLCNFEFAPADIPFIHKLIENA